MKNPKVPNFQDFYDVKKHKSADLKVRLGTLFFRALGTIMVYYYYYYHFLALLGLSFA